MVEGVGGDTEVSKGEKSEEPWEWFRGKIMVVGTRVVAMGIVRSDDNENALN